MQIITNQFQKELKQHGNEQFPFLVSYQKLSEYESGSFMWHWHPAIEITYVQKGTMCYKVNHMVYHLKEGDIVSVRGKGKYRFDGTTNLTKKNRYHVEVSRYC